MKLLSQPSCVFKRWESYEHRGPPAEWIVSRHVYVAHISVSKTFWNSTLRRKVLTHLGHIVSSVDIVFEGCVTAEDDEMAEFADFRDYCGNVKSLSVSNLSFSPTHTQCTLAEYISSLKQLHSIAFRGGSISQAVMHAICSLQTLPSQQTTAVPVSVT